MLPFQTRKRFGQHFLHDNFIIEKIISAIDPKKKDYMLEIGPGMGALSVKLLPHLNQLRVVELDRDIIPLLKEQCTSLGKLIIYQGDALKFALNSIEEPNRQWRIVGNLPYNISTPLLFHLLQQINVIQDMHFMLQKEVVERIVAQPEEAAYGRLSVMIQYYCQVKNLFIVKSGAFNPRPKVNSAFIRLIPYQASPWQTTDPVIFTKVVRTAFSHRRKMLRNSLSQFISSQQLISLNIDPEQRPEQLSVMDYVTLSNFLSQKHNNLKLNKD